MDLSILKDIFPKFIFSEKQHEITVKHSFTVGYAAFKIASKTKSLDPEKCFKLGMLHDIGKFYVSETYKHPLKGYDLLVNQDVKAAEISLSHAFPHKNSYEYVLFYCEKDEIEAKKIIDTLQNINYDIYVKLIQFCDKVSGIDNFMTLDSKFKWYESKNGTKNEEFIESNKLLLKSIKNMLDEITGVDVYEILGLY